MAQNLLIEIQVKDNQALARVNGLQDSFENLETTIAKVEAELGKMNKTSNGTVSAYSKQIKALEELRDETAKTNKQYRAQTKEIDKLKKAQNAIRGPMKGSVGDLIQQRNALIAQQKALATTTKQFDRYQDKIIQVQSKIDQLSSSTTKNVKVNEDLISNAGLAGATLTEVGRTISDLPYGIRGVANNLSQLSTLFVTLVSKTDGAANAIGLLKKQLSGPLGLILAFQAALAALDFFFGATKKAEKGVDDLTDSVNLQLMTLDIFIDRLDNVNISLERRNQLLKGASTVSADLKRILDDTNLTEEERNKKATEFIKLEAERIRLEEKFSKTQEEIVEGTKKQAEAEDSILESRKKLTANNVTYSKSGSRRKAVQDEITRKQQGLTKATEETNKAEEKAINLGLELADILDKQSKLTEKNVKEKKKSVEAQKELNNLEQAFLLDFKSIQLQARGIQFQRLRTEREEEISVLKRRNLTKEEFEKEKLKITEKYVEQEVKLIKFILQTDILTTKQRLALRERLARLTKLILKDEEEPEQTRLERIMEKFKTVMEFANFASKAVNESINSEMSAEERKTTLLNNELKKRLLNEKLTSDQKRAINNQIGKNEADLQAKRDKLAEKQFKLQKAISIGQALINTYEMATRAYNAVLAGPEKFLGISSLLLAKIAAGTATAFGLAQVNAIRQQQFVPGSLAGTTNVSGLEGGSGGGAPAQQEPVFNIVGTGTQMQLAETVAQRTGEPIKAFVVSNDITTAQELDRNIITGSAIG
jgi:hypothetical protein